MTTDQIIAQIRALPPQNPAYLFEWFLGGCEEAEIIPGIYIAVLPEPGPTLMREWIGEEAAYAEQLVPAPSAVYGQMRFDREIIRGIDVLDPRT